ncbi:MAG: class I SAM-dependent methyltransferase [Pseudomonadota bacterium]
MGTEQMVAAHYTTGALYDRVIQALRASGVDPDHAAPEALAAGDEFHTGGREATDALLEQLTIGAETRVLDIGSGIGGPARHIAQRYGCHVTGVDLTEEFVETARRLSDLVGMGDKVRFLQGSGTELPLEAGSVDLALILHVGMNIADKDRLTAEAARVLSPGGTLAIFDVMRAGAAGDLIFPLPWSSVPETSFVVPPAVYKDAATAAGLTLVGERDRSAFALDFFAKSAARIEEHGPAPLGIHLMMGETAGEKLGNYVKNLEAGRIAPTELIFRRDG